MVSDFDYPACIVLALGLYSFSAGLGALINPQSWTNMISNVAENPAIRFLIGIFLISIGTALYLVGSWNTTDQMVIFIKLVSLVMVIEGALFLAVGEWVARSAKMLIDSASGLWAYVAVLFGLLAFGFSLFRMI